MACEWPVDGPVLGLFCACVGPVWGLFDRQRVRFLLVALFAFANFAVNLRVFRCSAEMRRNWAVGEAPAGFGMAPAGFWPVWGLFTTGTPQAHHRRKTGSTTGTPQAKNRHSGLWSGRFKTGRGACDRAACGPPLAEIKLQNYLFRVFRPGHFP